MIPTNPKARRFRATPFSSIEATSGINMKNGFLKYGLYGPVATALLIRFGMYLQKKRTSNTVNVKAIRTLSGR